MNRRWDKKLIAFAVTVTVLFLAAGGCLFFLNDSVIPFSVDRIEERAEEGFASLKERVSRTENISQVILNRRGKFENQNIYRDFDPAWLSEIELTGYEYDPDTIPYDRTLKFALRAYDKENVYKITDGISVYTKFSDSCMFYMAGEDCWVSFMDGGEEYRFTVRCKPLTDWLAGMK